MTTLPRDLWAHIRSFSGDRATEPTPSARLINSLEAIDDTNGTFTFPFGQDGYASSVLVAPKGITFFPRWPYMERWYFRTLHLEYDGDLGGGWPIRARSLE